MTKKGPNEYQVHTVECLQFFMEKILQSKRPQYDLILVCFTDKEQQQVLNNGNHII